MDRVDRLLAGALDLHAHGYPEISLAMPARLDNVGWAEAAVAAGMRGFVMKSHVWPTTTAAQMLRTLKPDLDVFGSITLNPPAGGLSAVSVELAAQAGARVVWMPTWSARTGGRGSIFLDRMKEWVHTLDVDRVQDVDGLSALGLDGGLTAEVWRIIDVCRRYELTLASGHLPVAESRLLAQACRVAGVRFIFTHPLNGSVSASIDDQIAMSRAGAIIEHSFIAAMPMHHRVDPRQIVASIEAVGPEHCVMTSDAIEAWNPPAPEVLRMFIATMLALGVKDDAVHAMTHDNAAAAIGVGPWQRGNGGAHADVH
jgi:Family of unknown function (DUF6282)